MAAQEQLRILVIEDESTQRMLAKEYLEEAGHVVRQAEDGRRGLKMASVTKPDVILLDVMLPVIDGYSLCRKLKEAPETVDTPVVLMTASREADVIERGLAAGADDFVTKPVDWTFLADRVVHVVKKARASAELSRQIREQGQPSRVQSCNSPSSELGEFKEAQNCRIDAEYSESDLKLAVERAEARKDAEIAAILERHAAELEARNSAASNATTEARLQAAWSLILHTTTEHLHQVKSIANGASASPNDGQGDGSGSIAGALRSLQGSMEQLKLIAQIMSRSAELGGEAVELRQLLSEIYTFAKGAAAAKRISVSSQPEAEDIWVTADRNRLRYAILCLMSNALRFTPAGGAVELSVSRSADGGALIDVCDNGVGIAHAKLGQLRECLDRPVFQELSATGACSLGLPAAIALTRQMGARFELDSQLGAGTRATIAFCKNLASASPQLDLQRSAG